MVSSSILRSAEARLRPATESAAFKIGVESTNSGAASFTNGVTFIAFFRQSLAEAATTTTTTGVEVLLLSGFDCFFFWFVFFFKESARQRALMFFFKGCERVIGVRGNERREEVTSKDKEGESERVKQRVKEGQEVE